MINLSEVTIEYAQVVPEHIQAAEFYAEGGLKTIAVLTRGDREIEVAVNGEMSLVIPEIVNGKLSDEGATIVRYGDDLYDVGINNDFELNQFIKTISNAGFEVYRMNPWWEIFSEIDQDGIVSDSGGFYDAIDVATALLFDEEYWNHRDEWL
jgi:hypothetical protein